MDLSGKDIIGIIKAAGESGVKSLRLGEIEISWRDDMPEVMEHMTIDPSLAHWRLQPEYEEDVVETSPKEKSEVEEDLEEYSNILNDPGEWERKELEG